MSKTAYGQQQFFWSPTVLSAFACPSVCPSVCDICALLSQGAMDPGYLCMLG